MNTVFAWGLLLFAPLVFAYAGSSDLFNMRISNRLALVFLLAFPVFAYGAGLSLYDGMTHVGVGVLTLLVSFIFWNFGWIGGGDAKFAAVAGVWMGPEYGLVFFAMASIYGAVMTIFIILFRSRFMPAFLLKMDWAFRLYSVKRVPYGLALAAAGLHIYSMSNWMETGIRLALS